MLNIRTFGGLHISREGEETTFLSGRSTKMWEVLKYLLACYPTPVTVDKLIEAVWPDEDANDPDKSVKDIIYRLRKKFVSLGCGQDCILFTNRCYLWNPKTECAIDFVEFNKLLGKANDFGRSEEERISLYNEAISLYRGEFMGEKWSFLETWASNFVGFYKRLYLHAIESLSDMYENHLDYESIISLLNKSILVEPYEESLYTRLIQVLIKNGEYALAERNYRHMEKFFSKEFGTPPPQTLQDIYEEAMKAGIRKPTALSKIKDMFDEKAARVGPMLCAPDTFAQIYSYSYGKRANERKLVPIFLCKITLLNDGKMDLTKADLEREMKILLRVLLRNIRKGDIICRYSQNQFLLMLATANEIILRQVMQRINLFFKMESTFNQVRMEIEDVPIKEESEQAEQA